MDNANNSLESVKNKITDFSNRKFGLNRSFTSPLHHLKGEADEAIDNGELSEFADMLLCLLDGFRLRFPSMHTDKLLEAASNKIVAMEPRQWDKPDINGCFQHTK